MSILKEFSVGVIFLLAVIALAGIGTLLFPVLIVAGALLKMVIAVAFLLAVIWLLGKLVLYVLKKIK